MLNGKQKRYLRSLAVNENAIFQIGKDGLSDHLYTSVKEALKARELIKVSVLKTCDLDMNEIAVELCANTGAQLVQKIGKTLVLYKPSREKKILLP
ncbi:MAG: ribosome assembly RNA-binding protein YhbY [Erysipelotrichaceae bacterium]|nr:ribosome assembly RNA-binding protein YhbY [Erysipelotrichaceae bacterium]MBQ1911460.1 ribosome assembly RNA-binding protein YhbY [Erysipelotrichaceae bacterium]MBQ2505171.1 ribosome assembly RNA-binding protein YhbY [Erysipelotrichaceae bacterium]